MDYPKLSFDELNTIKSDLFKFVHRVASDNTVFKTPEEVEVLPEVIELLLRFAD